MVATNVPLVANKLCFIHVYRSLHTIRIAYQVEIISFSAGPQIPGRTD